MRDATQGRPNEKGATIVANLIRSYRIDPKISATLGSYADEDIFDRLQRIREGARVDGNRSPKLSEFDVFASGRAEIGHNQPSAKLYAQTLPREAWADPDAGVDLSVVKNIVAVHRLREVSCLYGFTRFEADIPVLDPLFPHSGRTAPTHPVAQRFAHDELEVAALEPRQFLGEANPWPWTAPYREGWVALPPRHPPARPFQRMPQSGLMRQ